MPQTLTKTRYFHAHETARFDELNGLPLASFKKRALAIGIDACLLLLFKLVFGLIGHHHKQGADATGWTHWIEEGVEEAKNLLESVFYFAIAIKLGKGQTPGKWLMGIRVLSLTHQAMGWWQSIERALGYGASLLEGGFGFVQYFMNRNRMCVHDRIAETIVVDLKMQRHDPALKATPEVFETTLPDGRM